MWWCQMVMGVTNKATPSQSLVSGPLQFMKSMWAGGILGLQSRKLLHYLLWTSGMHDEKIKEPGDEAIPMY